jgi:enamine deaminase RidA (YjgF/YER057c/UK114 family)
MTTLAIESASPPPTLRRQQGPGLHRVTLQREHVCEHHLTFIPLANETPTALAHRINVLLHDLDALPIRIEAFGSLRAHPAFLAALPPASPAWPAPLTWLEGHACNTAEISGIHVFAVAGTSVEPIRFDNQPLGAVFSDGYLNHALLGDVSPTNTSRPPATQAAQVFERLQASLHSAGFEATHIARTWLFLEDILAWYGPLNLVRHDFFTAHGIFQHLVPASTGIGVNNPDGAAMIAGAWAAHPLHPQARIAEVLSPMQCPAPEYGSSFSRAVEMVTPDLRRILVSGTASIEPKGASVCANDIDGQIDLTLQVVRAILVSRDLDFSHVTRATAYLRHPTDAPLLRQWCARVGLDHAPLVTTQAVVCRDELLFEIELDAHTPLNPSLPTLP